MASLGAVYGISFVAGSLASMGSAYMASKIYPIEDAPPAFVQSPVVEEPVVEESSNEPPTDETALSGGMRGGDRKDDIVKAIAKYDEAQLAIAAAKKGKNDRNLWNKADDLATKFMIFSKTLFSKESEEALNLENAARAARKNNKNKADIIAKDAAAKTALNKLIAAIKADPILSSVAAQPVVAAAPVKQISYTTLAVATDTNLSGFHFATTTDGKRGLILTSLKEPSPISVTYPLGDKTKFAVTTTYGLKVAPIDARTHDAIVAEVNTTKTTANIFILTNPEDLPDDKELCVYGSKTLNNWSTPKTIDQNAIKSAKADLEKAGSILDNAVKAATVAGATQEEIADALPAAAPVAPGDVPVVDVDSRIAAAILNARNPPAAAPPVPGPKMTALAKIPNAVDDYKAKYSNLKRLTDPKKVTILDNPAIITPKLTAPYPGTYKNYLMRGLSNVDLVAEDVGGPAGIEDENNFILVGLVTEIADPKHPIFTTVSQFIPTLKQFPIKLAKYDKITDKYVFTNVTYNPPVAAAPRAAVYPAMDTLDVVANESDIVKQKTLIDEFIKANGKDLFLRMYRMQIIAKPDIYKPLKPELVNSIVKTDPSMTGGQRGGTMADYAGFDIISAITDIIRKDGDPGDIYTIIENGPFVDGKSAITWEILKKIENLIGVFYGPFNMPANSGDYNTEILKINKRRAAKILTVTSWLRTVPKKTSIGKSYIEKIVPESLTFKQFIDILADMVKVVSGKPDIQLTKDIFDSPSSLVSDSYVINTSEIYKLTQQLVVRKNEGRKLLTSNYLTYAGKIEIKHIIKYFEDGGDLYTFFHFKNVLRVIYDFSFGDKDYDKVFINLSNTVTWLRDVDNVGKISNKDIENFKAANPRTPMSVLTDTLAFLVKEKIQFKNKLIRVTDFNAIETLDENKVDINTKIIKAVIDPAQITLPKPTAQQIQKLETDVGKTITPDDLILASLFVGSIELPNRPTISGLGDIGITSFSDPSKDGVQTVTFTGSNPSLKIDVRVTITGATESSNNVLNMPILSVSKKTFTIKNKAGVEEDNVTAKATLSRALPPDATSVIGMLDQIQNAIDKRKEADVLASMTRSEYKTGETVKQAKAYMKGTESEKERRMIEESLRKDEMIKQLEDTRRTYEESETLQKEAKAKFDKNLEKLVASNKLKELEALLKERDAELAKEYEKIKASDNSGNGAVKPEALSDETWNSLRSKIGPIQDAIDLIPIVEQFKTDNPGIDVSPYTSIQEMIGTIYKRKGKKDKNKRDKSGRSSNTGGTPKCADVSGRAPCIRKDGSLNAAGGYRQTLRNHLRSRRQTYRRI